MTGGFLGTPTLLAVLTPSLPDHFDPIPTSRGVSSEST